jgi:hypothetical protein
MARWSRGGRFTNGKLANGRCTTDAHQGAGSSYIHRKLLQSTAVFCCWFRSNQQPGNHLFCTSPARLKGEPCRLFCQRFASWVTSARRLGNVRETHDSAGCE